MSTVGATPSPAPVDARIDRIASTLSKSLHSLVEAHTGRPIQARAIEKSLGLNRVLCHRIASALRCADPLATLHQLPGPEPLRRLVAASKGANIPEGIIVQAEAAIDEFDYLIRMVAGDRSGLDAIISSRMPGARVRVENEAKQLVYRGMRQIKGVAADVMLYSFLMHPSDDGRRLDFVQLRGFFGLRCVRPGTSLKLGVKSNVYPPKGTTPRTLGGVPLHENMLGAVLERFCSDGPIDLRVQDIGADSVAYTLDWGEAVGIESARDIVMAELRCDAFRRTRGADDPRPRTGNTHEIHIPTRLYVNDLLMHEEVYPEWAPGVRVLETGVQGWAEANDPSRDLDTLDLLDSIEPLGTGIHRYRVEGIPNYAELLEHVFAEVGWDPSKFRAYRTRIEYPVFSSQVQHRWDVPISPPEPK